MIWPRLIFEKIKAYFGSPEAIIITGMRRTGKTTLLHSIYDRIASENKKQRGRVYTFDRIVDLKSKSC